MDDNFIKIAIIYLAAIISLGPSASIILKNSLLYGRFCGFLTSLGVVTGIAAQSALSLISLNFLLNLHLIIVFRFLAAIYFIYIGTKLISQKHIELEKEISRLNTYEGKRNILFRNGFIVEFLNPMAFTFFLSLSTSITNSQQPISMQFFYWLEFIILGSSWFCFLAWLFSTQSLSGAAKKIINKISILSGTIFIFFGIQLLTV